MPIGVVRDRLVRLAGQLAAGPGAVDGKRCTVSWAQKAVTALAHNSSFVRTNPRQRRKRIRAQPYDRHRHRLDRDHSHATDVSER